MMRILFAERPNQRNANLRALSGGVVTEPSAADKPFKSLVFFIIVEVLDPRFHKLIGNIRYYPKKTVI
jgi:hypothetical protein